MLHKCVCIDIYCSVFKQPEEYILFCVITNQCGILYEIPDYAFCFETILPLIFSNANYMSAALNVSV
jgi:hypothetical protein